MHCYIYSFVIKFRVRICSCFCAFLSLFLTYAQLKVRSQSSQQVSANARPVSTILYRGHFVFSWNRTCFVAVSLGTTAVFNQSGTVTKNTNITLPCKHNTRDVYIWLVCNSFSFRYSYSYSFFPRTIRVWNRLTRPVHEALSVTTFEALAKPIIMSMNPPAYLRRL